MRRARENLSKFYKVDAALLVGIGWMLLLPIVAGLPVNARGSTADDLIAVVAIMAGLSDPIWLLLSLRCILVFTLFISEKLFEIVEKGMSFDSIPIAKSSQTNSRVDFSFQTAEGIGFGTPPYMSPEQFLNAAECDVSAP
jgi:hypothetical protein